MEQLNYFFLLLFFPDAPSILSVGPSSQVRATVGDRVELTCDAEGNPSPRYQWLQKLPSQTVLIRGKERVLAIQSASYDDQVLPNFIL